MIIRQTSPLPLLICTLLLAGCGQTGALYLPEPETEPDAAPETAKPQEQQPTATGTRPAPEPE